MPLIQDIIGFAKDPTGKRSSQAGGADDTSGQDAKKRSVDLDPGRVPGQESQPLVQDAFSFLKRNGNKRSNGKTR